MTEAAFVSGFSHLDLNRHSGFWFLPRVSSVLAGSK
jgi:hypothetical protein